MDETFLDQRRQDLERNLDRQLALLRDYEQKRDLTGDPKERVQCRLIIDELRTDIDGYLIEYWSILLPSLSTALSTLDGRGLLTDATKNLQKQVADPDLPVRAKFELAVPLIPGILTYKHEIGAHAFGRLHDLFGRIKTFFSP